MIRKSRPKPERHEVLRREVVERARRGAGRRVSGHSSTGSLRKRSLAGFIGNDTGGVTIEIEGPAEKVETFRRRLRGGSSAALAHRFGELSQSIPPKQEKELPHRLERRAAEQVSTGIPADAATCADCLRELLDPKDRRYRYPFLNCTNCGPRFTITRRIPYDRPQTSMAQFKMCAACQAEYDDPTNRRFHAQPNACPVCGPRVWLVAPDGAEIPSDDPVTETIDRLAWPAKSWPSRASADSISLLTRRTSSR